MARIKDLIAAIVTTGDGYEDSVRVVTAAAHSAVSVNIAKAAIELGWLSDQEHAALRALVAQGVPYRKVSLKSGVVGVDTSSQCKTIERIKNFLRELQLRDELYYPFALIENQAMLIISIMDLSIIMSIAREYQQMQESGAGVVADVLDNSLPFSQKPKE